MAATGPWVLYNQFKLKLGQKAIDLVNDHFKVALFTSASVAINAAVTPATYASFAADAHEVSNANGYTTGGAAVTPTWSGGSTVTLATTQPSWTASGAGITARAAVLYDSDTGDAVAYMLLDSTPADVSAASGNSLTIQISTLFALA